MGGIFVIIVVKGRDLDLPHFFKKKKQSSVKFISSNSRDWRLAKMFFFEVSNVEEKLACYMKLCHKFFASHGFIGSINDYTKCYVVTSPMQTCEQ